MNQEAATKWVTALRSGDYEQGSRALNSDGKLCCLGVACEAAIEDGVELAVKDDGPRTYYDDSSGQLPLAVQAWLGAPSSNPYLAGMRATSRNDSHSETFEEIARAIEKEAGLA